MNNFLLKNGSKKVLPFFFFLILLVLAPLASGFLNVAYDDGDLIVPVDTTIYIDNLTANVNNSQFLEGHPASYFYPASNPSGFISYVFNITYHNTFLAWNANYSNYSQFWYNMTSSGEDNASWNEPCLDSNLTIFLAVSSGPRSSLFFVISMIEATIPLAS